MLQYYSSLNNRCDLQDGKAIYSSGSDQATCQFTRTLTSEPSSSRKTERWHLTNKRRVHQHDVRALACSPSYHPHNTIKAASILLSGGLDMSIMITPCGDERPHEMVGILSNAMNQTFATGNTGMIPYVPQSSVLSFSRSKRLILLRKHTGFAVWKIGNGKTGKTAGWTKVAEVQLKGKTNTTLGSISGDGQWILIGDLWRTGIWRLAAVSVFRLGRRNTDRYDRSRAARTSLRNTPSLTICCQLSPMRNSLQ